MNEYDNRLQFTNTIDDTKVNIEQLIKELKDKDNNMSKEELLER